jgi:hypothetical protein
MAKRKADVKFSRRLHERERKKGNGRQSNPFYPVHDAVSMGKSMETSKESRAVGHRRIVMSIELLKYGH